MKYQQHTKNKKEGNCVDNLLQTTFNQDGIDILVEEGIIENIEDGVSDEF